jgi:large subunit ribosomal protein L29
MKTNELRELGAEELSAKIREARKELADLKLKHASGVDVEKPGRMRLMRRNIARLLTIQNENAAKEAK